MRAHVLLIATVLGALAHPVHAQVAAGKPVARGDFALFTGSFSADTAELSDDEVQPYYERWTHMAVFEASAGYYWTDHLKTEVEALWTTEGETYGNGGYVVPGVPIGYVYHTSRYTARQFGIGQLWQFGRNAMFHPWIGGGVDFVHVDHELDRPAQFVYSNPVAGRPGTPVPIPAALVQSATNRALPFATLGFKAYFNERGFVRSDVKLHVTNELQQVIWKIGIGVDF
jgi:hypothetical protein